MQKHKHMLWRKQAAGVRVVIKGLLIMQVVRTSLRLEKGYDIVMFWYLETIKVPEKSRGRFGEPQCLVHLPLCHLPLIHTLRGNLCGPV